MAKAVLLPPIPVKQDIQLTLTLEEAETLNTVCIRIGGNQSTSRRRYMDAIHKALNDLHLAENTDDISESNRTIYFNG